MKKYLIRVYGFDKKNIKAVDEKSALEKGSRIFNNGDRRGVSVTEVK